jgi:hypothetical protein
MHGNNGMKKNWGCVDGSASFPRVAADGSKTVKTMSTAIRMCLLDGSISSARGVEGYVSPKHVVCYNKLERRREISQFIARRRMHDLSQGSLDPQQTKQPPPDLVGFSPGKSHTCSQSCFTLLYKQNKSQF